MRRSPLDEVEWRFSRIESPRAQQFVVWALRNKASALERMGRSDEAAAAYEAVAQRFGHAEEPSLLMSAAAASSASARADARLCARKSRTLYSVRPTCLAGWDATIKGSPSARKWCVASVGRKTLESDAPWRTC
jgi:hypothetical protein